MSWASHCVHISCCGDHNDVFRRDRDCSGHMFGFCHSVGLRNLHWHAGNVFLDCFGHVYEYHALQCGPKCRGDDGGNRLVPQHDRPRFGTLGLFAVL